MAGQLIPPPELEPPVPHHLTMAQRFKLWMDLVDFNEMMLLTGFRQRLGPEGDVHAAYRQWYKEHMEEHDEMIIHMLKEIHRREKIHGG